MKQSMSVMVSQETTEWYTPLWLIEVAKEILGTIDFDPATNSLANVVVGARNWAGPDHPNESNRDGLAIKWSGNVWINPPYNKVKGKSSQAIWTSEARIRFQQSDISNVLMIVNSKPGYGWYEEALDTFHWCMLRQRVCFLKEGNEVGPAKVGSTLLYLGADSEKFANVAGRFGRVGG